MGSSTRYTALLVALMLLILSEPSLAFFVTSNRTPSWARRVFPRAFPAIVQTKPVESGTGARHTSKMGSNILRKPSVSIRFSRVQSAYHGVQSRQSPVLQSTPSPNGFWRPQERMCVSRHHVPAKHPRPLLPILASIVELFERGQAISQMTDACL